MVVLRYIEHPFSERVHKCNANALERGLWRSILVSACISQDGPKKPLKGISMKSLVFASYAQFGVDAGG